MLTSQHNVSLKCGPAARMLVNVVAVQMVLCEYRVGVCVA